MIDIEERLSLDERSRLDFVLDLRRRWSDTIYPALAEEAEARVATGNAPEDPAELLHGLSLYPWFSHLERSEQKMMWRTAGDIVFLRRGELLAQLEDGSEAEARGTLELDEGAVLPDWYTAYDIHVQPGGVFGDQLSAFVYELGARIVMLRDNDGYKFHRLFTSTSLPEIPGATRVVDVGCGFGKSTRPLVGKYPAAEVIGVDLAASVLRLAHAEAEANGLPIRFRQADASATGLEAGSCDVVTGTMVLHEMPAKVIRDTIFEAARLLRPGGALRFLEFQPTGEALRDVTVYEHAERNNEPYFHDLFGTDVVQLCREAGLVDAAWSPFDERGGEAPDAPRPEWHFPWAVLTATQPGLAATQPGA